MCVSFVSSLKQPVMEAPLCQLILVSTYFYFFIFLYFIQVGRMTRHKHGGQRASCGSHSFSPPVLLELEGQLSDLAVSAFTC